ncbi:hypothetical protein [Paracoccus sp. DMF]|uniref:hypothetical protein n=1 Tax=Paracoccus sp. DMF TaxID=400837 RepID=UPI001103265F|nr:hypothetical protein [Paracoccus sp. DMF]MCV2448429.1 hypothetical protein [Paracoccus sp. DMF]
MISLGISMMNAVINVGMVAGGLISAEWAAASWTGGNTALLQLWFLSRRPALPQPPVDAR